MSNSQRHWTELLPRRSILRVGAFVLLAIAGFLLLWQFVAIPLDPYMNSLVGHYGFAFGILMIYFVLAYFVYEAGDSGTAAFLAIPAAVIWIPILIFHPYPNPVAPGSRDNTAMAIFASIFVVVAAVAIHKKAFGLVKFLAVFYGILVFIIFWRWQP